MIHLSNFYINNNIKKSFNYCFRALSRKKQEDTSGLELKTSPSSDKKKKLQKKKQKPNKIQLIQQEKMATKEEDKGRGFGRLQTWVVGNATKGRGFISDVWSVGEKALDTVAEHVIKQENSENGIVDRSSVEGDGACSSR